MASPVGKDGHDAPFPGKPGPDPLQGEGGQDADHELAKIRGEVGADRTGIGSHLGLADGNAKQRGGQDNVDHRRRHAGPVGRNLDSSKDQGDGATDQARRQIKASEGCDDVAKDDSQEQEQEQHHPFIYRCREHELLLLSRRE